MVKKKILILLIFIMQSGLFAQSEESWSIEIGNKYKIIQYKANVREKPSMNSNVIAVLSLNDEIEILEKNSEREKINNVQANWYKIKYGTITG